MKKIRKILPFLKDNPALNKAKIIRTDPQGSYTGRPNDPYEVPVQDVDDL